MTTVRVPPVPDQRLPRYQQICDDLARRIAASEWQPEQAIATEAELTAEYSVSPGTVRKAIDQLVASGVLTRSQGRGTYVRRPRFDSSLFRFFRFAGRNGEQVRPTARVTHRAVQVPAAAVRATLQLDAKAPALQLRRLRLVEQTPVLAEEIWLPLPRFEAIAQLPLTQFEDLLYPFYERCCRQVVASATEILRVDQADAATAEVLSLPPSSPVIRVQRTAFDFAGVPMEWRSTVGAAAGFEYQIEIR